MSSTSTTLSSISDYLFSADFFSSQASLVCTNYKLPNMQGATTPINRPDQGTQQIPHGQPMGPPPPPPVGYRPSYGLPTTLSALPRGTNLQNGGPIGRRLTAPTGATTPSEEKSTNFTENDVLISSGVDLKAEEINIRREHELLAARQSSTLVQYPDRSRSQSFLNHRSLAAKVNSIALQHKILNVHPDALAYLALATQERIRELIETMIVAKNHRIHSEHINLPPAPENGLPMYKEVVSLDVRSQLAALEKVEREQERKRQESLAGSSQDTNIGDEQTDEMKDSTDASTHQPKRVKRQKKDRDSTSSSSLKLSNEAIATSTNQTALVAAGGLTKSWMLQGVIDKTSQASTITSTNGNGASSGIRPQRGRSRSSSNGRPSLIKRDSLGARGDHILSAAHDRRVSRDAGDVTPAVTVKDALFVLERDRGGGGQAGGTREVLMKVCGHSCLM
ncbi:transcription initiation factor TFIID component TAF4 family-domain-containing protein [Gigaspora rosea]|uniref:Transcription initiation factor TFIID subunit 4 n=1 Tax=Gigaspora rosea TaxID=44941 RepID=A0A397U737_9GLOM|nr:transcription initiation factor TFIID component TAF4 family-domain-containing protein [Gigaspora rosea]